MLIVPLSPRGYFMLFNVDIFFVYVLKFSEREKKKSSAPELAYFTTFTVWQRRSKKERKKIRNFFIYSRARVLMLCVHERAVSKSESFFFVYFFYFFCLALALHSHSLCFVDQYFFSDRSCYNIMIAGSFIGLVSVD